MKKTMIFCLCTLFAMGIQLNGQGQKFGFMNSQALLAELPEMKGAEAELQAYQSQFEKKGQQMVQNFERHYVDVQKRQEAGEISPKDLEKEQLKLQQEQVQIDSFRTQSQQQILEKRQSVLQPILDKVDLAVKEVSKEMALTYVFDASTGILLYAEESLDITEAVKKKLGL